MENPLYTRKLTNADSPFVITEEMGIQKYSLVLVAGTGTIAGTGRLGALIANAIDLVVGTPISIESHNGSCCATITIGAASTVDFMALKG